MAQTTANSSAITGLAPAARARAASAWMRSAPAVATYLNGGDWQIVDEFTEVESGKNSDRPALEKALAAARLHRASLVVSARSTG